MNGLMRWMAWVKKHFVSHMTDDTKKCWSWMLAGLPIRTHMTPSDLALAVLVPEQKIMK